MTFSATLRSLAVLAVAAAIFAIAAQQFLGEEHAVDRLLLIGLPEPLSGAQPPGPHRLKELAWSMTALGSPTLVALITLGAAGGLLLARKWGAAAFLVVTVGSGAALTLVLKRIFGAIRPHHGRGEGGEFVFHTSFPSGHAMLATLLAFTLAIVFVRVARPGRAVAAYAFALATLVSLGVGISRWYLGLHWPSDALAGWCAAGAWVFVCAGLWTWARGRR
jgi:undecaprenyl-diphosphatase